MPTAKKRGRTVLGVRMGLYGVSHDKPRRESKATMDNVLPSLQSLLTKGGI
jgi:hypothetical protein